MVSVALSKSRKRLAKIGRTLVMQPILLIQSLPYLTAQLSTYGISFLKRPVVWMALGIHGALLVLPAVDLSAPKQEEIAEPEPPEEVALEAVSLSDILAPTEPAPPPPAEPQAPPPQTPPTPVTVPPVLTEVPEQLEEIVEEPAEEFEEEFEDEFFEEEEPEQSFGFDPTQQAALGNSLSQFLGASNAGTNNFDTTSIWVGIDPSNQRQLEWREDDVSSIADHGAFFTPGSIADGTYFAAPDVTFRVIDRDADHIRNEGLGQALAQQGMTLKQDDQYGGYPLYGIYDANQQIVNYISLVPIAHGARTLVFVWPRDPRQV